MGHPDCFGQDDEKKQKQIPFGDDSKKGYCNGKNKYRSKSPSGMTSKKSY
jgi:hypothetical protein